MPPAAAPGVEVPLTQRLSKLVLSAQFVWFLGHFTTVVQALIYVFVTRSSPSGASSFAKAFYGTLLSYGIILYKAHGTPQISRAYAQRVLMDENTQYLMLAFVWVNSKPLLVTLIPFLTFSIFHSLNYIRAEILPTLFPPTHPNPISQRLSPLILSFVQKYQSQALRAVAYLEVWITMPALVISIFLRWTSFLSPLLYANFLRFRYYVSPMTKEAFGALRKRVDGVLEREGVPPAVKGLYGKARDWLIAYGDVEAQARAREAGPAGGAGAAGAGPTATGGTAHPRNE
ncbi:hypothetical protein HK097_004636 [Rhizophlyctis rosea]|uniref:Uncharacterized protein n=1 Tax=Rhizophlyctis rosea TaxID=64517 RepID=A0AAD5WZZ4_9FUNG|nr:hypothetical protein HK097_004636 [Rhizophlyctis rosea]